jgi:large subunit ribosomal protein L4
MAKTTLPAEIFDVEVRNHELVKLAYDSYLADQRRAGARTKRRGEVSGGGRKPWRQKGTGRARVGSIRSPLWRGGGITFGPIGNANFTKSINKRSKKLALRQALTMAAQADKIKVLDVTLDGKTKTASQFLVSNKITQDRVIIVVDQKTDDLTRATNNLANVELVSATYLNVFRTLNAKTIIMTPAALEALRQRLSDMAPTQEGVS